MKKILMLSFLFLTLATTVQSQLWTRKLDGRSVWSLAYDGNGNIYAGGLTASNSRIWKSSDQGQSWDTIYTGSGQTMWDFAFDELGTMYVANYSTGLLKSTNGGQNFTLIPSNPDFSGKNLQGVECAPGGFVYVTTSTGFFLSTDYGAAFNETALTGLNCLPVLADNQSPNIVYVGVSSGTGTGVGVYRSTDHGFTFSDNLLPNTNGYGLMQTPNGDVYRITTTSPYTLAKSTDRGLNWSSLANLPSAMRGITYGGPPINWIVTAGNGGVFVSYDGGETFSNLGITFSSTPALYVEIGKKLMIFTGVSGTANGGVWIHTLFIDDINNNFSAINDFILYQNYPNPFNPGTVISYSLKVNSDVSLKVYNALGKEVTTLVNGKHNAGNYSVEFSGAEFSSGIYFYRLQVDEFTETKRMVLMK
jgi:hypothetical protein